MEEELGIVKQICEIDENGTVYDKETGTCINPKRKCENCPWYHETWNTRALINGLNWILEGDKFSFGNKWMKGSRPATEEENAGYVICRVIEYLENQKSPVSQ